ncbi:TetR/AcrR family transcriptional regulator [Tabrizicola sp. J26]|uniref:TetR/AcrR family transcriptional regulator n=1 Tax=Alitabrizicola rongguiensis TaxID=2909234 RepID=UPI001F1949D6|nr:TetR/AcrR family transcriptional regulator [Tabrizicola rongguiensis]MCF1707502.1 TetR/AcrR family transcriptional regulator [Tabrizicola rongguiensis]
MTAHSPDFRPPIQDSRQADILQAVRTAFIEKGFDGASMQDLARATGMSVGNFYRYFPSKSAIVAALIEKDVAEVERDFAAIQSMPNPFDGLRLAAQRRVIECECSGEGQIWAEITAAALRKGDVAEVVCRMEMAVHESLLRTIASAKGIDFETARERYTAHIELLMLLVKGASTRVALRRPQRAAGNGPDLTGLVLRTIDQVLDEISNDDVKV